jgi:regulator of protease activity HflC (stomatin/prohibitin superfamily)
MGTTFNVSLTLLILLVILLPLLFLAIKIMREYQRLVVFRLGRCIGELIGACQRQTIHND